MPIPATSLVICDNTSKVSRFLLGKRKYNKHNQKDHWCFPGGAQEKGESIEKAARRELTEETGLQAGRIYLLSYDDLFIDDHHYLNVNFYCDDFIGELRNPEPDKFHRWEWFPLNDFPLELTGATKQVFHCLNETILSSNQPSMTLSHPLASAKARSLLRRDL